MTRQSRLIIVLAVMAVFAVVALAVMAERYSRIASREGRGPDTEASEQAADAQVVAFVRVRSVLRQAVDDAGLEQADRGSRELALAKARDGALAAVGMDRADYGEMRGHFARWSKDPQRLDPVWRAALERHATALEGCDLGALEELDR